jgi:hypothetical protein
MELPPSPTFLKNTWALALKLLTKFENYPPLYKLNISLESIASTGRG